jgi:hypothetical protein
MTDKRSSNWDALPGTLDQSVAARIVGAEQELAKAIAADALPAQFNAQQGRFMVETLLLRLWAHQAGLCVLPDDLPQRIEAFKRAMKHGSTSHTSHFCDSAYLARIQAFLAEWDAGR